MRRTFAILAAAAVAATISAGGEASSGTAIRLAPIGRLRFPDRGYLVDLSRHTQLTRADVVVRENGSPVRDVRVMPAGEAATTFGVVLLIDASDSMRGRPFRDAVTAARAFVAGKNPREEIGVIAFNQRPHVLLSPTSDDTALRDALARPPRLANGTHIYDAVARALLLLEQAKVASGAVVLLSDGTDTGSALTEGALAKRAKAKHVRIFTVGLRSHDFAAAPLRRLALDTNASYTAARSTQDLERIYSTLSEQLASEYLVEYRSSARPRSRVHVTIEIKNLGAGSAVYTAGTPRGLGPYHRSLLERFWNSVASMIFIGLLGMLLAAAAVVALLHRPPPVLVHRLSEYLSFDEAGEQQEKRPLLSERLLSGTERSLSKTRWWARFEEELEIAGVKVPPAQIVVGTAVATLIAMFVLALIWVPLILGAVAVPLGVREVLNRKLTKLREGFLEQLPDNLQVLASALRAGHSFIGALAVVANDAPEPARREFQRVVADEQLGVPIEDSLREVARRMANNDVEQVALLAELQREAGGNMAEVLDTVVDTIRDRFDLRRLVKTLTAQGRMARWILSLLPAFLLCVISLLNPGYVRPLFASTGGRLGLMLAAAMVVAGSLVIKRIVNIKV